MEEKEPLIILTGPTAVGKTDLSLKLAKRVDGEIISADSMQVYRQMDIGSAKIKSRDMQGIPHHLIDIMEPEEEFNVVTFQQLAKKAIADIRERGRIPIITGGTGFYIQSVLYDIDFTETRRIPPAGKSWNRLPMKKARNIFIKCWLPWIRNRQSRSMPTM